MVAASLSCDTVNEIVINWMRTYKLIFYISKDLHKRKNIPSEHYEWVLH
jgi:hypothetical protein